MRIFYIIIPVYNDWKSFNTLIKKIDKNIKNIKGNFKILAINDASTSRVFINKKNIDYIRSIKILNLKENCGSQKAIFLGLKYIKLKAKKSTVMIMDTDGEDDPQKIIKLIQSVKKNNDFITVAKRSKRKESFFLRSINYLRLFINFILTDNFINFGNFSAFDGKILKPILSNNNLWLAYSGGILKNYPKLRYINIDKKKRYFGFSKVSFKFLLLHSLNILSIFHKKILLRSAILIFLMLVIFKINILLLFIIVSIIFLNIVFCLKCYFGLRENKKNLVKI